MGFAVTGIFEVTGIIFDQLNAPIPLKQLSAAAFPDSKLDIKTFNIRTFQQTHICTTKKRSTCVSFKMIGLNRLENSAASYFAETQVCKVGQGPCQGQAKAKAFKSGFHQIPTFSLVIGERLESFIGRNELRLEEKTCGLEMFKISFFRLDCNYSSSQVPQPTCFWLDIHGSWGT